MAKKQADMAYSNKRLAKPVQNTLNYSSKRRDFMTNMSAMNHNLSTVRSRALNQFLNPGIDLNFECRYPDFIDIHEYTEMYARNGVASRVVSILPDESWAIYPEIAESEDENETQFEKDWKTLENEKHVLSYLHRIDVLSGIGEYGVLLMGVNDGKTLNEPIDGIDLVTGKKKGNKSYELLYLKALAQSTVRISKKNADLNSARYGMPEMYEVELQGSSKNSSNTWSIHWTRLIHVADNRESSEIIGVPRMKNVYNYLLDIRKVLSGSGEMFWKGGFPGLSFETSSEPGQAPMNTDDLEDQIEDYQNGLQRYLATEGITVKSLSPQVSSPKEHIDANLKAIAITKAVPYRIFLGTEEGKLAGGQDAKAHNKRIAGRQIKYVSPYIIRPCIDRFIALGILPEPTDGYIVTWADLDTPSDSDMAEVAVKITDAMVKYTVSGADAVMAPFEFFTIVLGYSDEEAKAIEKGANLWQDLDADEEEVITEEDTDDE